MSKLMFVSLLVAMLSQLPVVVQAQALSDTLDIRFQKDSTRINMDFDGNRRRWTAFERNFLNKYSHLPPGSLRLDIYSGASPEGYAAYNQWLGENRGNSIRLLVEERLGPVVGNIVVHNEGARWDDLYAAVARSREPWRKKVLAILDMNPTSDPNKKDHREFRLRELEDGRVWPILRDCYIAPLRNGVSSVLSWQGEPNTSYTGKRDTIVIRETIVHRDTVVVMNYAPAFVSQSKEFDRYRTDNVAVVRRDNLRRDSLRREYLQYPSWAVKTNFLLWGVVAPNVQVELPLGRSNCWSVEAEFFMPWFVWNKNARAWECLNVGAELRYWLGQRDKRRWLEGWHIGLAVAGGYYDFEWKKHEGYQGEHLNTYVNIGYQHRWGAHWALDFGVGFGALFTKYRHYYGGSVFPQNHLEEWDEHLIFYEKSTFKWFGPCHANVTMAYMFNAWPFHFKSKKLKK